MEIITYKQEESIAYITLNRPDKRNALNEEMVSCLMQAFNQAELSEEVKIIILTGAGKVFCAGADLAYLQQLQKNSYEENLADSSHLKALFYKIYTMPKIVIAQVHGHAIAGGCGLASVCDLSFAAPNAKFGYTEVKIGFIPAIVKVFLIRKIGEAKAKELLLTGDLITAEEAHKMGLINYLSEAETLEDTVKQFAQKLVKENSTQAMALTKKMMAEVQSKPLEEALDYAAKMNAQARASSDCKKGIAAFLDKKPMVW